MRSGAGLVFVSEKLLVAYWRNIGLSNNKGKSITYNIQFDRERVQEIKQRFYIPNRLIRD